MKLFYELFPERMFSFQNVSNLHGLKTIVESESLARGTDDKLYVRIEI